jgi:epoxyqueuosine reductase
VLERDLAQRAGLGWAGKNTCLIHPQHGSYFLLAEMLIGVELAPDAPFLADHCGSCTRCLQACPTGCILPDRTIDARRCISYLTIELKGPIPAELRSQIGNWVFGCDICQQVCPWNERAAQREMAAPDAAFALHPHVPQRVSQPDLIAELALTPDGFNRKFKRSPVRRAKRRGYLRNVALALGNLGDPAAVSSLAHALHEDGEPLIRGAAAWALGQLGDAAAQRSLAAALEHEQDASVQAEIHRALAALAARGGARSLESNDSFESYVPLESNE